MTAKQKPTAGYSAATLASDLPAGLVVFLVALPLCLGIALASSTPEHEVPLFAGVLAGIIGGLVVGSISGSHTSVSGPAAGLTAVIAAQIAQLGSFEALLLAVLMAGVLQITLGIMRAGSIAAFVPSAVIKGLLAAIGLILILKQIPHLFGHDADPEGEMSFFQIDERNTFSELLEVANHIEPGALVIGLVCLVLLIVWTQNKRLRNSLIPGPLAVVLVGVGLYVLAGQVGGIWSLGKSHLVQVPVAGGIQEFVGFLRLPDFTAITNVDVYTAALTIAIVASLETMLNVEAVDKLDPQKRTTPANRELVAQGVGNVTAGLIGALPVTSVIVRSSVNISSGGKTKVSCVFHGMLLLVSVMFFPQLLNMIPLSALAAVLIVTGFKLAKPSLFRQMWREGPNQFLPFVLTVVAIVFTDLLIGIIIGLAISILFILRSNLRRPMRRIRENHVAGEVLRVALASQVSFLNRAALLKVFDSVPSNGHLLIDARRTEYIDADVQDLIREYMNEIAPARGVEVSMLGLKEHYDQLDDRVQYVDYTTREMQSSLTPEGVLQILREGNQRFLKGEQLTRDLGRRLEATAESQNPLAIVLSGASSRTPVEMIFDMGVGDLYCARVIGNYVSHGTLGNLEHACVVAGAKLIVVMGHSNSAACRMAIESRVSQRKVAEDTGCENLAAAISMIAESLGDQDLSQWKHGNTEIQQASIDELYNRHIGRTIQLIRQRSPILNEYVSEGKVNIVGAMYDVHSGRIRFDGD